MYLKNCLWCLYYVFFGLCNIVLEACPLGSYCPLAKLNKTTGVCEPWVLILDQRFDIFHWFVAFCYEINEQIYFCRYLYQLPPMQPNHTCGGANVWADVSSSSDIFCSAGSYCPTTTKRISCSSGYYFAPKLYDYTLSNLGSRRNSFDISSWSILLIFNKILY